MEESPPQLERNRWDQLPSLYQDGDWDPAWPSHQQAVDMKAVCRGIQALGEPAKLSGEHGGQQWSHLLGMGQPLASASPFHPFDNY